MAKNKAHKAVQDYAKQIDGSLLYSDKARKLFIDDLKAKIKDVNKEFTRCGNVELSGWNLSKGQDKVVAVDSNFYMTIYQVNHEFYIDLEGQATVS